MGLRFNPAPGWPPMPPGFNPPPGWQPDPSWPPAPPGWQLWIDDTQPAPSAPGPFQPPASPAPGGFQPAGMNQPTGAADAFQSPGSAPGPNMNQAPGAAYQPPGAYQRPAPGGVPGSPPGVPGPPGAPSPYSPPYGGGAYGTGGPAYPGAGGYPGPGSGGGNGVRNGIIATIAVVAVVAIVVIAVVVNSHNKKHPSSGPTPASTGAANPSPSGQPAPSSSGQPATSGEVDPMSLQVGDCFDNPSGQDIQTVTVLPCTQAHDSQVFAREPLNDPSYPGDTQVQSQGTTLCNNNQGDINQQLVTSNMRQGPITPEQDTWNQGDHEVICIIVNDTKTLTTSLLTSNGG